MMSLHADVLDFYKFNFCVGVKSIPKGFNRLIISIEYFRCHEYPLVFNNLRLKPGLKLIDIGSANSIFPLFVCSKGIEVWATDIDNRVLKLRDDAEKLGIINFHAEIQDARNLLYPDSYFDRVTAISTLEHIPNDGDSVAVKEMSRVLKPGGIMVITVPYGSFEKERQRVVCYFQRVYDKIGIHERLIKPSGLNIVKIEYFGETKVFFTKYWQMIPHSLRIPFLWAQPIFSKLFLKNIDENVLNRFSPYEKDIFMKTGGVCLTLKKRKVGRLNAVG